MKCDHETVGVRSHLGAGRIPLLLCCIRLFFLCLVTLSSPSLFAAAGGDVATSQPIDLSTQATEIVGYLLIFILLAAAVVRLGKRFQPSMGANALIQVEDGRNLAPGVGVRLIRVGGRAWLVGVTREHVSLLAEMSEEEIRPAKEKAK